MQENFKASLEHVLSHEGGYVDHPKDPGGATNKGITLKVFRRFYGSHLGKEDLRNLTVREASAIYKQDYWDKCRCDELAGGVDYAVFDQAVNSGPGRSARWLQQVIGTTVDGGIGPQTLLAAQSADATAVVNGMCDLRLAFLKNLETWDTFGRGWERRINDVREMALSIAGGLPIDLPGLEKADFEILKAGSQGEQVVLLQKRLNKELQDMPGYMPLTENGEYNPETERAVTTFQALHGLEADGIAGHYTLQALGMR